MVCQLTKKRYWAPNWTTREPRRDWVPASLSPRWQRHASSGQIPGNPYKDVLLWLYMFTTFTVEHLKSSSNVCKKQSPPILQHSLTPFIPDPLPHLHPHAHKWPWHGERPCGRNVEGPEMILMAGATRGLCDRISCPLPISLPSDGSPGLLSTLWLVCISPARMQEPRGQGLLCFIHCGISVPTRTCI